MTGDWGQAAQVIKSRPSLQIDPLTPPLHPRQGVCGPRTLRPSPSMSARSERSDVSKSVIDRCIEEAVHIRPSLHPHIFGIQGVEWNSLELMNRTHPAF